MYLIAEESSLASVGLHHVPVANHLPSTELNEILGVSFKERHPFRGRSSEQRAS